MFYPVTTEPTRMTGVTQVLLWTTQYTHPWAEDPVSLTTCITSPLKSLKTVWRPTVHSCLEQSNSLEECTCVDEENQRMTFPLLSCPCQLSSSKAPSGLKDYQVYRNLNLNSCAGWYQESSRYSKTHLLSLGHWINKNSHRTQKTKQNKKVSLYRPDWPQAYICRCLEG